MVILRALAWVILLVALIALVSDVTRATTGGPFIMTSALTHWKTMAPQSLATVAGFTQRWLHPMLWDPALLRVLLLPTWLLLGALALLLGVLGRKKRRINIFAN